MNKDEILALSNDELRIRAAEWRGWRIIETPQEKHAAEAVSPNGASQFLFSPSMSERDRKLLGYPLYLNDIAAAMDLFNEVFNPRSKLYGGAWVLGTVDGGKDCSLATLFFKRKLLSRYRPEKVQAKAKPKQMARAITLVYVLAMEGATIEPRYQPEERSSPVRKGTRPGKPPKNPPPPPPEVTK